MPLSTGSVLQGRYRIAGLLGKGGMGAVYLAEDTRLPGRRCAIKENVPDPSLSPQVLDQLREQFLAEANILARLDHPNLPKVSDYFTQGSNQYLVMDYVEGENLESLLEQQVRQHGRPLPEPAVLDWADQVLEALQYLHSRQPYAIIHRDIKPSNIVLSPDGKARLVDFGLVKLFDPANPGTAWVMKGMGTPEYTPLEQYPTSQAHTDARSDIYSLSATLYDLLTGQAPATASQRVIDPSTLVPPRKLNSALSPALNAALLRGLAITPDQRFQSAAEMRRALVQASQAAPAKGATRQPGGRGGRRALPLWAWAAAGAALLLAIFATARVLLPGSTSTAALPAATIRASSAGLVATFTPTNTQAPPAPTPRPRPVDALASAGSTATPPPTAVAAAAPTSTPLSSPTATLEPSPAPTETPTETAVARPSPTRQATTAPLPSPGKTSAPAPAASSSLAVAAPAAGSAFSGAKAPIVFEWQPVEALAQDEYYVVTLWFPHGGDTWQDVQWTRESSLPMPDYIYANATLPGTLQWSVVLMRQTGTGANGERVGVPLTAPSAPLAFTWAPDASGDGGPVAPTNTPVRPG